MAQKTILITGSTDGIGLAAAQALAEMGHFVILHGRNWSRGQPILERLQRETGSSHLGLVIGDFSDLKQVRLIAEETRSRYPSLDVLINNAGVYQEHRTLTKDGYEMTFAVNHLATFVLTLSLLEPLITNAPARIVTVSSTTHRGAKLDWDNLQGEKRYLGYAAYAQSKLANVLFTFELAERLKGTGVTANCLHPGAINTKLLRAGFSSMGSSPQQGAETPIYLAVSPDVEGLTGQYYSNKHPAEPNPLAYDRAVRQRFWQMSEELTGIKTDALD